MNLGALAGVAAGSFISTNVDNLALTSSQLAASAPAKTAAIIKGQLAGFAVGIILAWATASALFEISARWVGLLGLVPLALGIKGFVALAQVDQETSRELTGGAFTSAFVTLGASADNLAVYIPLLKDADHEGQFLAVGIFCAMDLGLCAMASVLGRRLQAAQRVQRMSRYLRPVLYCAIGVVVLWRAGTL
jgi:cadmium resistance protein CadD (predicted permease)